MLRARLPDGRALAPLECPLSTAALEQCEPELRVVFALINEARLTGSIALLRTAEAVAGMALQQVSLLRRNAAVDNVKALNAAIGECWSIRGRWNGKEELLRRGAEMIEQFATWVDSHEEASGDVAMRIRAHAFYGNALTRLAYQTRYHSDLDRAFIQLERQREQLDQFQKDQNVIDVAMLASWARDAGDVHVGILHWSTCNDMRDSGDGPFQIDGEGIKNLRHAREAFARLYRQTGDATMLDEWGACESSLAVAQGQTARLLCDGLYPSETKLKPIKNILEVGGITRSEKERCRLFLDDAEATAFRVWRVYIGLLNQPARPSWRWTRSISNIAHALSYVVMVDGAKKRRAAASLSEVAFRSILDLEVTDSLGLMIPTEFDGMWYGDLLGIGRSAPGGKAMGVYYGDDHPYRYAVNEQGLKDLIVEIQNER
jgi:hypothetical protein